MSSKVIAALIVAVIMSVSLLFGWAHYKECTRLHPWWYCVTR